MRHVVLLSIGGSVYRMVVWNMWSVEEVVEAALCHTDLEHGGEVDGRNGEGDVMAAKKVFGVGVCRNCGMLFQTPYSMTYMVPGCGHCNPPPEPIGPTTSTWQVVERWLREEEANGARPKGK